MGRRVAEGFERERPQVLDAGAYVPYACRLAAPTTPLPATAVRLQTLKPHPPSVAGKLLQRTLHGRPVCLPDVRDRSGRSCHAKVTVGRAAQPSCPVRVAGESTT
eukprot:2828434-Prymnesium_polylepis.1